MSTVTKVIIGKDGSLRFIYTDRLACLLGAGKAEIKRASHVEPVSDGWEADMAPVGGPKLGPFPLKDEALTAEVAWLLKHGIPNPGGKA